MSNCMKIVSNVKLSFSKEHELKELLKDAGVLDRVRITYPAYPYLTDRALSTIVHVHCEVDEGRGYEGGHNTAARMGWPVNWKPARPGSIASIESEWQGTWTGYQPLTLSFFIEKIEIQEYSCADKFEYNTADIAALREFAPVIYQ